MAPSARRTDKQGSGAILWAERVDDGTRSLFFKALECSTVVGFNVPPGGIDHLPARNNDNVDPCQWFTAPEELANEAFRPVPDNGVPNLVAGCDAEARRTDLVWQGEAGHEP